ncbi:uncharacterized mitochondrial protein AtMg00820-like [Amaranthus tricolor]|uniref:uncharacterized mitochondrial protein AtMg00820-like n=1 Tax=Amaranthus tricolor TaxID=29722 RepID=UPI002582E8B2|nr:uncharacterized mitochondrial protein AtMg00820-like [Amaranthus tricolor]
MGRGFRTKYPNVKHKDFVTHTILTKSSSPPTTLTSQHPSAILSGKEPRSFKEAMRDAGWRKSMQDEIRALENNSTWNMEDLPPGKKALGSKWVYRIKYKSDGSVERLKSRLVVLGNHQKEGIDYNETFAPVAKMVTVRAFLAIAASKH